VLSSKPIVRCRLVLSLSPHLAPRAAELSDATGRQLGYTGRAANVVARAGLDKLLPVRVDGFGLPAGR
jgi:hypothetical protein